MTTDERLKKATSEAYDILERQRRAPAEAVSVLRAALAEDAALRTAAEAERGRLAAVLNKRGARACHISAVTLRILNAALEP